MNNLKHTFIIAALVVLGTQSSHAGWFGFSWPSNKKQPVTQAQVNVAAKQQVSTSSKVFEPKVIKGGTGTSITKGVDIKTPVATIKRAVAGQPAVTSLTPGPTVAKSVQETKLGVAANKEVTLTIVTSNGGYVLSKENNITCLTTLSAQSHFL